MNYAIGDVQGCLHELETLVARIGFDRERDRLLFTGDLVNRGPDSLGTLRWVRGLGERAVIVLGNHDLHLLAVAAGVRSLRARDTFQDVLAAPDAAQLLDWLRALPLLHHDAALGYTLVHAGLPPQWDLDLAREAAAEIETRLRGTDYVELLRRTYGDGPDVWSPRLRGWERWRFIVNGLTRMRYCDVRGRLFLGETGPPGSQPEDLMPWFQVPGRRSRELRILFGHWSTLRLSREDYTRWGVYGLDEGCVWGGNLLALRLEDGRRFRVSP